jgi:hypothetical protein
MNRSIGPMLFWASVAAGMLMPIAMLSERAWSSSRRAHEWTAVLRSGLETTKRLEVLDKQLPDWALWEGSENGFAQQVSKVLAATGLPPGILTSLSADGEDRVIADGSSDQAKPTGADRRADGSAGVPGAAAPRVVRRRASISLSGLTLPQFGQFLRYWKEDLAPWTITSIDISPIERTPAWSGDSTAATGTGNAGGGDLGLQVQLRAESLELVGWRRAKPLPSEPSNPVGSRP